MPSLLGYVEKYGKLPKRLAFSIAALLAFYKGDRIEDAALIGERNGESYKIMDDPDVLEFFRENSYLDAKTLTEKYLGNVSFHGQDLTEIEGLCDFVSGCLQNIRDFGTRKAMELLK